VKSPSAASAKVERAYMNGSNRDVLVDTNLQWPNGLSIDLATNTLYWCDAFTDRIQKLDLTLGTGNWVSTIILYLLTFVKYYVQDIYFQFVST